MYKLFLLFLPLYLFSWELHKETDNIRIYIEHPPKFKFAQYKAQMLMPYSIQDISDTIMDYHSYTSWLSDCIQSDKVGEEVYILMSPPWPLSHRQVWATIEKIVSKQEHIIRLNSIDANTSKHSGVWFTYLIAEFSLKAKGDLSTQVTLSLIGDPGGYPPAWLVNLMAWKIPYQSLYDLNNYLKISKP
ncbi:MAG: hypothetical protein ACJAWW_001497 [Sulfurimonas sp.]|jgi:hypothetical protein